MSNATQPEKRINRREFLAYVWGASVALAVAETAGAVLWASIPRGKPEGEFGLPYPVDVDLVPAPDGEPVIFPGLRFWLVHVGPLGAQQESRLPRHDLPSQAGQQGVLALDAMSTHRPYSGDKGCFCKWVETRERFEDYCWNSRFHLNGTYIDGSAPRNLDRMFIRLIDQYGRTLAHSDPYGLPVPLVAGTTQIIVETGRIIPGQPHG